MERCECAIWERVETEEEERAELVGPAGGWKYQEWESGTNAE